MKKGDSFCLFSSNRMLKIIIIITNQFTKNTAFHLVSFEVSLLLIFYFWEPTNVGFLGNG